jgi:hypothetical protein
MVRSQQRLQCRLDAGQRREARATVQPVLNLPPVQPQTWGACAIDFRRHCSLIVTKLVLLKRPVPLKFAAQTADTPLDNYFEKQ